MTTYNSKRAAIIAAFPGTVPQIIKRAAASRPTVREWIRRLRTEPADSPDKIYIKRWSRTRGQQSPVHAIGNLPDAKKPGRMTQAQYSRRTYLKNRRPVEMELRAVRKLARQNASRIAKAAPQPWWAALGAVASVNGEG
jgi:transposase